MRNLLATGALLALTATPALAQQPFYVQSVRQICQLPRPDNNGRVVGHDNGSSVKFNGTSYFFFADTVLDSNGNGGYDPSDGTVPGDFINLGTVASTGTDHRPKNCLDLTDYKTDGHGTATSLYPPSDLHEKECNLWPIGSVVANGKVYIYGSAPKPSPEATLGCRDLSQIYTAFLSTFDPATRQAHRLPVEWAQQDVPTFFSPQEPQFNYPTPVTHSDGSNWIYVVGTRKISSTYTYYMARVPAEQAETKSAYQYQNGSTWASDPLLAAPIFHGEGGLGQVSVVYNKYLKHFLMVYTCAIATKICGRTATVAGKDEFAISGGWSDEVEIYQCPPSDGLGCYAAFQHGEFAKRAIYVTTARLSPLAKNCTSNADCRCTGSPDYVCHIPDGQTQGQCDVPINLQHRYGLTLHEITLSKTQPVPPIARFESASVYSPGLYCQQAQQGIGRWYYDQLKNGSFSGLNFDYTWNWVGTESVSGIPVPQIDQDSMVPTANAAAVRLWQPLYGSNGLIRISGEARKKFSCGGKVHADIIRVAATGNISRIWFADLQPGARSAIVNFTTNLNVGDSIGFRAWEDTGTNPDPACDRVVFSPLIQK